MLYFEPCITISSRFLRHGAQGHAEWLAHCGEVVSRIVKKPLVDVTIGLSVAFLIRKTLVMLSVLSSFLRRTVSGLPFTKCRSWMRNGIPLFLPLWDNTKFFILFPFGLIQLYGRKVISDEECGLFFYYSDPEPFILFLFCSTHLLILLFFPPFPTNQRVLLTWSYRALKGLSSSAIRLASIGRIF